MRSAPRSTSAKRQRGTGGNTRDARHERARAVAGNLRLLPPDRPRRIDLRPARRQRRQARQPAAPRRPHHHRNARPHPRLHGDQPQRDGASGGHRARHDASQPRAPRSLSAAPDRPASAPAQTASGSGSGRSAAQFPLLRQPAEVSAVRQHLLGEVGGGEPRLARARQHPSAPAGAARVRRRRRRRHGAAARDARDARPLPAHAVLRGRQGDQPRGRPPRHAEDGGPLHRASGDRAGADQPRLRRRAVACGEVAVSAASSMVWHEVALTGYIGAPVRAADHRSGAVPRRELEGGRQRRRPATRSTSGRSCW